MPAPAPISVRPACEADLAAVTTLLAQLTGDPADAVVDAGRRAVFDRVLASPGRAVLVAERDGAVVGTVDVLVVPNLSHGGRPWAAVENMVVDERHRGAGVGRALLRSVLTHAAAQRCFKVQLLSRWDREAAHGLYRSMGMETSAAGFRVYLP